MSLELEIDILIDKGKLGSALKLIAAELGKIPTCKLAKVIESTKELTEWNTSVGAAHDRLDFFTKEIESIKKLIKELKE